METTELQPRETATGNGVTPRPARKRFDPTQLFAQRDRLPWFWFFVAVAVSVLAALDRYHIIQQFKQRERVVIIDPAQTYYISPLLQFQEAKDLHVQQAELAAITLLERNPKDFDHPDLLRQVFLKSALQKVQDQRTREAVEFRAKQLHQKPEIAKIEILATRENEVLATVSGQVIRTGIFQEKAFNEAFNFKSVVMSRNPMTFVAPHLPCGAARGGRIPAAGCNRRATKPQGKWGATRRASVLFGSDFVVCSSQTAGGYARRARLACAKNPWTRTPPDFCS